MLSALNQEIIENMEAGVIVLGHNDTIRHINRAARELLHLPIDRAISLQRDCPQLLEALKTWRQTMERKSTHTAFTREIDNLQISFRELHREDQPKR